MKAIQVSQVGGPEVLTLVDLPIPKPKPNEAVVQIKAAGVNFIDVYFREGRYPSPLPFINGQEGAGVVTEVGSEVSTLQVGDRVAYTSALGSYAEYAAVPAARLVKVPDALSFEQAAAAMLQGMTAHYLVYSTYVLKKGETALVHAAAGGVGLLLVQMAKKIGARVIATAGTEEKAQLARDAGADECIVYTQADFETETQRLTDGKGVHVVYDGVAKATFDKDLEVLLPRGYLVLFGGASGAVPPFDLIKLSQKGSLYITRPTLNHYTATREDLEWRANDVMQMIVAGDLKLRIHQVYPLAQAEQAHRDLEGRKTTGKLLLQPQLI
ncbi:MAG TPA: quinone oxidoreductase [Pyrinomonadaceae bacterium]|nr:quinone oxidoreductase [Pyrinomonadaceae bacterium]